MSDTPFLDPNSDQNIAAEQTESERNPEQIIFDELIDREINNNRRSKIQAILSVNHNLPSSECLDIIENIFDRFPKFRSVTPTEFYNGLVGKSNELDTVVETEGAYIYRSTTVLMTDDHPTFLDYTSRPGEPTTIQVNLNHIGTDRVVSLEFENIPKHPLTNQDPLLLTQNEIDKLKTHFYSLLKIPNDKNVPVSLILHIIQEGLVTGALSTLFDRAPSALGLKKRVDTFNLTPSRGLFEHYSFVNRLIDNFTIVQGSTIPEFKASIDKRMLRDREGAKKAVINEVGPLAKLMPEKMAMDNIVKDLTKKKIDIIDPHNPTTLQTILLNHMSPKGESMAVSYTSWAARVNQMNNEG